MVGIIRDTDQRNKKYTTSLPYWGRGMTSGGDLATKNQAGLSDFSFSSEQYYCKGFYPALNSDHRSTYGNIPNGTYK